MGATPAEAKNNLGFAYETQGDLNNAFQLYSRGPASSIRPAAGPAATSTTSPARRSVGQFPLDPPAVPSQAP